MKRGMITVADLRARSSVDPVTGCWHWLGAKAIDGTPRIWTVDHERADKRSMSGPKAVWNIAHQKAPLSGYLIYRRCVTCDCVNPVHMAEAKDKAAIGIHISRNGARKGTNVEQRRANASKGRIARGIVDTPADVVLTLRAAPASVSNTTLAAQLGMSDSTVSSIRRGRTRASCGVAA